MQRSAKICKDVVLNDSDATDTSGATCAGDTSDASDAGDASDISIAGDVYANDACD